MLRDSRQEPSDEFAPDHGVQELPAGGIEVTVSMFMSQHDVPDDCGGVGGPQQGQLATVRLTSVAVEESRRAEPHPPGSGGERISDFPWQLAVDSVSVSSVDCA
jgi:hypothetical protein